jgi:ketosteroid isomerase-like protein
MSEENVEVVRRLNDLWKSRDLAQIPELCDPEIVIDTSRNVFNPDAYRGYDGVQRLVEGTDEMWDSFEVELLEVIDAGDDTVFAASRISGVGRGSGVEVEMDLFQVVTLRDGKVVSAIGGYRDRAEALEDAGLSE